MNEIKCPNCGEVFVMDASRYAQIVQQVRDQEFKEELNRRAEEIEKRKKTDMELVKSEQKQEYDQLLHSKDLELSKKEKDKLTFLQFLLADNIQFFSYFPSFHTN